MSYNEDVYTKAYSRNKIFISAGTAHFFDKNSMMFFKPDSKIANIRQFFRQKEAAGHPVAFLYPHEDEQSETYNQELKQTRSR